MATVTNTGGTNIQGNLGTGGTSITGFPPGNLTGSLTYSNNSSAALADANIAYTVSNCSVSWYFALIPWNDKTIIPR
jgi:hypothetical protein